MSYLNGSPNGSLYLGRVKWDAKYKHVVLFSSEKARNSFFKNGLNKITNSIIYASPTNYIDVRGRIGGLSHVNYCFYQPDSDITDEPFCCFVTGFEFIAPNTTRLYLEIDVFQQYYYGTVFYQTLIRRGHVATDSATAWLAPEPFSVKPEVQRQIGTLLDPAQWEPQWVLHCASYYNKSTAKYEYAGVEDGNTFGEYGKYIDSIEEMQDMIDSYGKKSLDEVGEDVGVTSSNNKYGGVLAAFLSGSLSESIIQSVDQLGTVISAWLTSGLQDHRDELIGVYAIPKWARGTHPWATNERTDQEVSLSLTSNLACGYTPRNQKMLSSMCKAYGLYNRNGFLLPLQPELFSSNPIFILSAIPMGTTSFYVYIENYNQVAKQCQQISYSCERRVGFDANTGLNKTLNVLSNGISLVGSAAAVGAGISSGGVGLAVGASQAGAALNSALNMADALGQQGMTFGSNGDLLSVSAGHATLRFMDVSPTYAECQYIDDFLDMYGYQIDEIGSIKSWVNTRPVWNYLQTENISCAVPAPNDFANTFRDIFNNGVTIWHDYDSFGNYSLNNRPS